MHRCRLLFHEHYKAFAPILPLLLLALSVLLYLLLLPLLAPEVILVYCVSFTVLFLLLKSSAFLRLTVTAV